MVQEKQKVCKLRKLKALCALCRACTAVRTCGVHIPAGAFRWPARRETVMVARARRMVTSVVLNRGSLIRDQTVSAKEEESSTLLFQILSAHPQLDHREAGRTFGRSSMALAQVPFRSDFSIGTGILGFSGLPANKPWAFEDAGKKPLNCAPPAQECIHGNVTVSKGVMSSTSHYKNALLATSSISVKLWGAGAHASSKLLTELELNKKTVDYVVVCNFETESINYLDANDYIPVLSKPARDLLVKVGPQKWAEQYGTHFVAGYVRGGTYVGKATITDSSTEGSHEFAAKMGAKFGRFASGSASVGAKFDHLKVSCK